jgi:hypothetical protein
MLKQNDMDFPLKSSKINHEDLLGYYGTLTVIII